MRARKRDIGTRCSGRSPRLIPTGKATGGKGRAGAGAAALGTATAAGAARAEATVASTSPLVMRPSLPLPATDPAVLTDLVALVHSL